MKHLHNMKHICVLTLIAAALISCARSEQPVTTPEEGNQTVTRMVFNGSISLWDATKGDPVDWVDGQAIYIGLNNGTSIKKIVARYYASESEENRWRLSYDGSLADYSSGDCKCYYFVDKNYENTVVNLDYNSVIYADENSKFSIVDNALQVSANLTPYTGRIKFTYPQYADRSRYYPSITGFRYYSQFNLSTFEFTTSDRVIESNSLNADTDTYLYVSFNSPDRKVSVWDRFNNDYIYTRVFKEGILERGKSNWLYWPTNDYHNEWTSKAYFISIADCGEFTYVIPGTFNMGGDDAQPIHQVTISKPFYIARYEVRQTNWTDITGDTYNSDVWANDYWAPAFGKSWEQVNNYIQLLNARYSDQGYRFRLPTEAEWEYCAKSGIYQNSNKYGSTNDISQIVWDGVTATPGQLQDWYTNALSMWGVSGNVSEWVSDWYADYPDTAVTDPKGPATGEKRIKRGGARNSPDAKYLTVTYRDAEETDNSMAGVRLVLDINQ